MTDDKGVMTSTVMRPPRVLRKRLWQGGILLTIFLATLVVASHLAGPDKDLMGGMPGGDLIPSYMAGSFIRQGRTDLLMNLPAAEAAQKQIRAENHLEPHKHVGRWLNPPFFAWLFVPLSALPYRIALVVWCGFNLLLTAAAIALLCRMLPESDDWKTRGLVPLLLLASFPFIQAMAHQQNTFLSLFLLTATASLWRKGRALGAGLVAGLLFFKPQLAAVVALVLCAALGWRAVVGLAITGASLLLVTVITLPGTLTEYFSKLSSALPWLDTSQPYLWERQVTFQGFWRLIFQLHAAGPAPPAVRLLWAACTLVMATFVFIAVVRARRNRTPQVTDRLIATTVTSMPLLMPYFMDYDLLLLAVPAVLLAAETCRTPQFDRSERWLRWLWIGLFPWLFLNASIAGEIRVNLTVVALSALGVLQSLRIRQAASVGGFEIPFDVTARIAA